jgi:signal transduction histidine kinase
MLAPLATAMLLVPLARRALWAITVGIAHNAAWHAREPAALFDPRTPATLGIYATSLVLALALGHALYLFAWRVLRDRRQLASFNARLGDEVQRLARRIERLHEDERTRLASELHDELGQTLTALRLEVALLEKQGEAPAAEALNAHLDELFESVRWLVSSLSPRALEERGLTAACEWLVDRFRMRTRLTIHAHIDEAPPALGASERLTIFRVLQEALTNVARHAEAQRVDVALTCQGDRVELCVDDDGAGFDPAKGTEGHGLWAMRERARAIGAELAIAARDRGTRVRLSIPLIATEAA